MGLHTLLLIHTTNWKCFLIKECQLEQRKKYLLTIFIYASSFMVLINIFPSMLLHPPQSFPFLSGLPLDNQPTLSYFSPLAPVLLYMHSNLVFLIVIQVVLTLKKFIDTGTQALLTLRFPLPKICHYCPPIIVNFGQSSTYVTHP